MSSINLYKYQNNIVGALRDSLRSGNRRILISAPTGSGKTIISKWIIKKLISSNKKVLFTTPRIKLAIQTQESFGFGNLILGSKTKDNNSLCTRHINTETEFLTGKLDSEQVSSV